VLEAVPKLLGGYTEDSGGCAKGNRGCAESAQSPWCLRLVKYGPRSLDVLHVVARCVGVPGNFKTTHVQERIAYLEQRVGVYLGPPHRGEEVVVVGSAANIVWRWHLQG